VVGLVVYGPVGEEQLYVVVPVRVWVKVVPPVGVWRPGRHEAVCDSLALRVGGATQVGAQVLDVVAQTPVGPGAAAHGVKAP
jgi:hypothetical protein